MSENLFEKLVAHTGHQVRIDVHGLPAQNAVIYCEDCDHVVLDVDAEGDSLFELVPVGPPKPEDGEGSAVVALPLPQAA